MNTDVDPVKREPRPAPVMEPGWLLDGSGLEAYAAAMADSSQRVVAQWRRQHRPCSGISPQALSPQIDAVDLDRPLGDLASALEEAGRLYLRDAVYFHHPHCAAHLNCPVLVPALAAEVILSAVNSSMDTWDQSIGASLIEQKLMNWTAARCGLPAESADGVMTSGGTQSNLAAMLLARDLAAAARGLSVAVRQQGLPADFRRMKILAADSSHFSIRKASALLGLGEQAVLEIPTDTRGCLTAAGVAHALRRCRRRDWIPIVLVATAGSTDFGGIDPLPELAGLCREHALRLHVDAAYGGGLLASGRHRQRLAGIGAADSITIDYHKSWFQPVSCSALLLRDRRDWACLTHHADYLNPERQTLKGWPNLVNKSLQTTRRFDAFKLWVSLRSLGADAIGRMFDAVIDLAGQVHAWLLLQPDIELATPRPPMLSTVLFRYRPPELEDASRLDALNQQLRDALMASGLGVIGGTRRHQRQYLKFTLLNPRTTLEDLQQLLQQIRRQARLLLARELPPDSGRHAS